MDNGNIDGWMKAIGALAVAWISFLMIVIVVGLIIAWRALS